MIDLKNKNAFITGSSRGIGQQIAIGLARLGCNIVVHGRTRESCEKTLVLLKPFGVNTYCVHGDLSNEIAVNQLVKQVIDLGVNIDILYNNAAMMTTYRSDFWTHSWDNWLDTMRVNVCAMYSLCAAFIPGMIENGFGRVINLSSGIMHQPELAPYGASKWAVNKLTDDLAARLSNTGVRINTLDPGWIQTEMGGPNAQHPVSAVLPGALAPALIDNDGPNGEQFSAINHKLDLDFFSDAKL